MICPNCQNEVSVSEHWDFFDCTSCKASLQLENGEIKLLKAPENNLDQKGSISSDHEENPEKSLKLDDELQNEQNQDAEPIDSEEVFLEEPSQEDIKEDENLEEFNQETKEPSKEDIEKSESFSEATHFGDTPAQNNSFIYKLHISDIKDEETLSEVKKVLKSPRLKLDGSKMIKKLSNNSFQIQNLHAVKASYLVRKLSLLSVKVSWSQNSPLFE